MIDLPLQPTRRTNNAPIEKPHRVKSPATIQNSRRKYCECCGRSGVAIHQHHVRSRGARGDDSEENLLSLCWECHDKAHRGLIPRARLLAIVTARSVTYGDLATNAVPVTSPCLSVPCLATTAATPSTCSKYCSNGYCGRTASSVCGFTDMTDLHNPTPLHTLTIAELDAYRSALGAKKLAIRVATLDAGVSIKAALPLLQPYTQRINEINAEEERRQNEATEGRRAKRANLERTGQ